MEVDTTVDTLTLEVANTITVNNDYTNLINKPQINSIVLSGNKTTDDLGLQAKISAGENIQINNNVVSATDTKDYNDLLNKPTIPTKTSDLTNDSGFITSDVVPTKTSDLTNDSGFITSSEVPTKTSELTNDSGFITSSEVPTKTSDLTNDSGFITSSEVPTKTSELTNDSGFITSSEVPTKTSDLTNDSDFITSSEVPTKTSELINDSGFLTQHQDISGKLDKQGSDSRGYYTLYGVNDKNVQAMFPLNLGGNTSLAMGVAGIQYGRINAQATPTGNYHLTNKLYVDTADATKVSQVTTTSTNGQVYGVSSAGEQVTFAIDGANGIASKSYVDNLQDEWELINEFDNLSDETIDPVQEVVFSQDSDGNDFSLKKVKVVFEDNTTTHKCFRKYTYDSSTETYTEILNNTGNWSVALNSKIGVGHKNTFRQSSYSGFPTFKYWINGNWQGYSTQTSTRPSNATDGTTLIMGDSSAYIRNLGNTPCSSIYIHDQLASNYYRWKLKFYGVRS